MREGGGLSANEAKALHPPLLYRLAPALVCVRGLVPGSVRRRHACRPWQARQCIELLENEAPVVSRECKHGRRRRRGRWC